MNPPKVLSVRPLENKKMLLQFSNGVEKIYDCKPLMEKFEPFKILESDAFFNLAQVDAGGYGISWNDKVDLSNMNYGQTPQKL